MTKEEKQKAVTAAGNPAKPTGEAGEQMLARQLIQVNAMVKALLHIDQEVEPDASDALAAAICHANSQCFAGRLRESGGGGERVS